MMSATINQLIAHHLKKILLFFFLFFIIYSYVYGGSISLRWDPVDDTDLEEYKVYYGTSSVNYTNIKAVGNVATLTRKLKGLDKIPECK